MDNPLAPAPAYNLADLPASVFPMLSALGPHLCHDPALMYKVLRVAKHSLKQVRWNFDLGTNFLPLGISNGLKLSHSSTVYD